MTQATVHAGQSLSGGTYNACLVFIQSYLGLIQGVLSLIFLGRTHIISQPIKEKEFQKFIQPLPRTPGDLSHHLSLDARQRVPNAIKNVWRMAQARGPGKIITLANGDPHQSLYPIRHIGFEVATVDGENPVKSWCSGTAPSQTISNSTEPGSLGLNTALAYGAGAGLGPTLDALTKLVQTFHSPKNHAVTLTLGNSDGITKCFRLFGDRGDTFLADELTFSALTNAVVSQGVKWAPVKIDDGGLIPEDLERILAHWDERVQGKRPHLLYTVPCGQNPTGSTLSLARRKKIYAIAQSYDLIILEDDPYYFLQFDRPTFDTTDEKFLEKFASSFIPSFLSLDVEGRVLRVDSFSKILAPGMRLGTITCSPAFHKNLIELTDNSTQQPAGFGQLFVTELLGERGWSLNGFAKWVDSLSNEYERRRNFILELFNRRVAATGYATASVPQAGMFLWIKLNLERHPRYQKRANRGDGLPLTNCKALVEEFFVKCMDEGLAIMPAPIFLVTENPRATSGNGDDHLLDRVNFLRATFAGTEETMEGGLAILESTLCKFFNE